MGAVSEEGAPLPTFQSLKVTRQVWENQGTQSPASLGSPCPSGAAECDLAEQMEIQMLKGELHPFQTLPGLGIGCRE